MNNIHLAIFSIEAVIIALLVLFQFRMRSRFGLSPLYITLGVFQPVQTILASTVYVEILPGMIVSPGSVIMFTASLFVILLVYVFEDAIETRKAVYGIVFANLTMTLLLFMFGRQLELLDTFNFLGLSREILNRTARAMLIGTIVLFTDAVLLIFVYEAVWRLITRNLFLRIYLTMTLVLTFDSLAFTTGVFYGQPNYAIILTSGIIGKLIMAAFYALILTIYLRFAEPSDHTTQLFRDIFDILSYRQKYEVAHQRGQQTESLLRESEGKYQTLARISPVGIFRTDANGITTYVNPKWCEISGVSLQDALGDGWLDAVHPDDRERVSRGWQESTQLKKESSSEYRFVRPDGTIAWVMGRAVPEMNSEHQIVGYVGTITDITERKQAEKILEQRAHELQTLYQTSLEVNAQTNLDSLLHAIVQRAASLVGVESGGLYLLQANRQSLKLAVSYNLPVLPNDITIALGEGLSGRVAQHGEAMVVEDYRTWEARLRIFDSSPLRRVLGVPLKAKENVIGVINMVDRTRTGSFSDEEMRLVSLFADQAALAIENARLYENAQRRLNQTLALREIDHAITASVQIQHVLKIALKHVIRELGVDAAVILLYDPREQILRYELGSGFQTDTLQSTHLRLGEGYAGRAALGRQTIYIPDFQTRHTDFLRSPTFHREGFVCYFGIPLIARGEIMGVLEIFHRSPLNPDLEWLGFMEMLAGQIAIAIDNATLYRDLQRSNIELTIAYDATIEGWARALELRDMETEGHSRRVVDMTLELARKMGIEEEQLSHVRQGALLHDIGKMGVPDSILQKTGSLTDDEWEIIHQHPVYANKWLAPISYLKPAMEIPYCHHEKWDGTGYPSGLKGEQIPLAARIFAVVDVWDALTNDRPYRPAWTREKTLEYIKEQSGKYFDPKVVDAFLELISSD